MTPLEILRELVYEQTRGSDGRPVERYVRAYEAVNGQLAAARIVGDGVLDGVDPCEECDDTGETYTTDSDGVEHTHPCCTCAPPKDGPLCCPTAVYSHYPNCQMMTVLARLRRIERAALRLQFGALIMQDHPDSMRLHAELGDALEGVDAGSETARCAHCGETGCTDLHPTPEGGT